MNKRRGTLMIKPREREQLMTVADACDKLQVGPVTVRRWLKAGKIPGSRTTAGWRIKESDIDAFVDRYRNKVIDNDEGTD